MEVNPRFAIYHWYARALGFNVLLACLKVACAQEFPAGKYPEGKLVLPRGRTLALFFEVLDHLLYSFRTRILKRSCLDPLAAPESLRKFCGAT